MDAATRNEPTWNRTPAGKVALPEAVPADLSGWVEKGTLLRLVFNAVQSVDWPAADFHLSARSGYAFRPLVITTLLTYCYATGVYSSKDIELKIAQDEVLRFLCAETFPTWREIRNFRRQNRDLIRQSLVRVFQAAHGFSARIAASDPAGGKWGGSLRPGGAVELSPALTLVRAAEARIRQAESLDSLSPGE